MTATLPSNTWKKASSQPAHLSRYERRYPLIDGKLRIPAPSIFGMVQQGWPNSLTTNGTPYWKQQCQQLIKKPHTSNHVHSVVVNLIRNGSVQTRKPSAQLKTAKAGGCLCCALMYRATLSAGTKELHKS